MSSSCPAFRTYFTANPRSMADALIPQTPKHPHIEVALFAIRIISHSCRNSLNFVLRRDIPYSVLCHLPDPSHCDRHLPAISPHVFCFFFPLHHCPRDLRSPLLRTSVPSRTNIPEEASSKLAPASLRIAACRR